jgi:hypothetical protein
MVDEYAALLNRRVAHDLRLVVPEQRYIFAFHAKILVVLSP